MNRIEQALFVALTLSLTAFAADDKKAAQPQPQAKPAADSKQTPGIYYCAVGGVDAIALKRALTPPNEMKGIYNSERNTLLQTLRALGIQESDLDNPKRRKFVMGKLDKSAARVAEIDKKIADLSKNNINILEGHQYKMLLKEKKSLLSLQRWMEGEKVARNEGLRQSLTNWIKKQNVDPNGVKPSYPIRNPADQTESYKKLRASRQWVKALESESKGTIKQQIATHAAHFGNTIAPTELRKDLNKNGLIKFFSWSPKARGQLLGRGAFAALNIFTWVDFANQIQGACSPKVEDLSNVGAPVVKVTTQKVPATAGGIAKAEHKVVDVTPVAAPTPKVVEQVPAETHAAAPVATTHAAAPAAPVEHAPEAPTHATATPAPASEAPAAPALVSPPLKVDTAGQTARDTFFDSVDTNRDTSSLY